MVKNEKGSSLVIVLLMAVVLSVLALTLIASTINDARQSSSREQDVISIHQARRALEEAIAKIKVTFDYGNTYISAADHEQNVLNFVNKCSDGGTTFNLDSGVEYTICENTPDYIAKDRDLSRKFEISTKATDQYGRSRAFTQNVYLTAIPSFLYYAVGSRSNLNLNGATTIIGNIYVNKNLYMRDIAEYHIDDPETVPTFLPFAVGKDEDKSQLVIEALNSFYVNEIPTSNFPDGFSDGSSIVLGESDVFNDVDIPKTFVDKINERLGVNSYHALLDINFSDLPMSNYFYKVNNSLNIKSEVECNSSMECSPVYISSENGGSEFTISNQNIFIPNDHWLIIDGDLFIESQPGNELTIDGNILVTGDVTIIGDDMKYDSSIISLGTARIYNAQISGKDADSSLILFAENGLDISRINEFDNEFDNVEDKKIKAFLYTASDATLYGVGSRVMINGGVFAKGDLTINAVRGIVTPVGGKIDPTTSFSCPEPCNQDMSRFYVEYDRSILTPASSSKAYNGLPRTERLSIVIDRMEIK